jgi:hypothetical protein
MWRVRHEAPPGRLAARAGLRALSGTLPAREGAKGAGYGRPHAPEPFAAGVPPSTPLDRPAPLPSGRSSAPATASQRGCDSRAEDRKP